MSLERYSKGKIYKIVDNTNGNIYVGSTCKTLSNRLAKHRGNYKEYLKGQRRYITSFKIIENGDFDIILLEKVNAKTKDELKAKERYYIDTLDCVNKVIPGRTKQEYDKIYYEQNREKKRQQCKQYREKNKERIRETNKIYNTMNKEKHCQKFDCECGGKYTYYQKSTHFKTKKHQNYLLSLN